MILCGTDLSTASEPALTAAAALARKQGRELLLVTVLEPSDETPRVSADLRLEADAADLRRNFEITVETRVLQGAPEAQLLALARERGASLIVVGASGRSRRGRSLGSVAEHLCQASPVPVLVARNSDSLTAWCRSTRALRVLLGSGLGDASHSALSFVADWPDLALTVVHVAWPYGEHYRLGIRGPMPLDQLRPEVQQQLVSDLGRWASDVPCRAVPRLRVTAGWGRIDTHLAQLAEEKEADLLVVGSHQRNLAERVWHGSVSRNAIHEAPCNVLCVPQSAEPAHAVAAPSVIVVPTDFSPLGDRAIKVGYSLLARGGTVHLLHVRAGGEPDISALEGQLRARVPASGGLGIETQLAVLEEDMPWRAVWQYAERAGASLICMGTHSRDRSASFVLGSQALALLHHSRIPVLLVPPDRES